MSHFFPLIEPDDWTPPRIAVVGMGTGGAGTRSSVMEWIGRAEVLVGSARHLALFHDHPGEKFPLGSPLSAHIERIDNISKTRLTAVLASGDPLFFGIGKKLGETLGRERLLFVPNITSVQALCARIGEPWGDMLTVSLHGRESTSNTTVERIVEAVSRGRPVAVFTDPEVTPGRIAKIVMASGRADCSIVVGEEIGGPGERIREFALPEAADETFSPLNLVLLRPAPAANEPHKTAEPVSEARRNERIIGMERIFGFPENAFEREAGLITKMEVRAVALAMLRLGTGQVLWDVGAGSGSVSIEASRIAPLKHVFAIEQNEARYRQILENIELFTASTVTAIYGGAPDAFDRLPAPDRVFIGGSGKTLPQILESIDQRLAPGGGVVQTIVMLETLDKVKNFWAGRNFDVTLSQIQVSRSAPLGGDLRFEALNPVFIVSAWRRT